MAQQKERLIEFDALRFLALLLILYSHSIEYIRPHFFLEWTNLAVMYAGLGLFIFLSGYGLQYSLFSQIHRAKFNRFQFLQRRLSKIYPLYMVALLAYLVIFGVLQIYHVNESWKFYPFPGNFIVHLLGLQVIADPVYPNINTLWFVGMIIPFYLFFAFTAPHKTHKFIRLNVSIFVVLYLLKMATNLIDFRLLLYYPIFILGALCARQNFLSLIRSQHQWKILLGAGFLTFGSYGVFQFFQLSEVGSGRVHNVESLASYVLISLYLVAVIPFLLALASQTSSLYAQFQSSVIYLANLSYAAYLFHRVVYAIVYGLIPEQWNLSVTTEILVFFMATGGVFGVSDLANRGEHLFWKWWNRNNPKIAG